MKVMMTTVETSFGYNVQITTYEGIVIGNSSDGVLSVAQRFAINQAITRGADVSSIKKNFISLLN